MTPKTIQLIERATKMRTKGKTIKEIADTMHVSAPYISILLRKNGVSVKAKPAKTAILIKRAGSTKSYMKLISRAQKTANVLLAQISALV